MSLNLAIRSAIHDYTVHEVADLAASLPDDFSSTFALVDSRVADLHPAAMARIPESRRRLVKSSEEAKSYDAISPLIQALLEAGFQRRSTLVVIGGGVVQDIGCFVATNLMRGVPWIFYPTTLLAQCDSCIGAKSSINIGRFKNQLGSFYPPHEVRLHFAFLRTLTPQELRSGLGEAIKLHLIAGEAEFAWLSDQLPRLAAQPAGIRDIVESSLRIKQRYIEEDEFDRGVRNLLNYGHTFAHAFESATLYRIPHGIAVTMGVASATYLSERLGFAAPGSFDRLAPALRAFYEEFGLIIKSTDPAAIHAAMRLDKKNVGEGLTFILTRGAGCMFKQTLANDDVARLLPETLAAL